MSEDLDDAAIAYLEAVAQRTVDYHAPPVLGESVDVWEHVHQTGGGNRPTSHDAVTVDKLNADVIVIGPGHATHAAGEDLTSVAADLCAAVALRASPASMTITDLRWRPGRSLKHSRPERDDIVPICAKPLQYSQGLEESGIWDRR